MRIAVVAPFGVHPPRAAGHHCVLEPALALAGSGHEVLLVTFGWRRGDGLPPRSGPRRIAPGVVEHRIAPLGYLASALLGRRSRLPPVDLDDRLERAVPRALAADLERADLGWTEGPWGAAFLRRRIGGPLGLVVHNVEAALHAEALRRAGGRRLLARAEAIEGAAWRAADAAWVCHDGDRRLLETQHGARRKATRIAPFGVRPVAGAPWPAAVRARARRGLGLPEDRPVALFAASAHHPNQTALRWLLDEVLPRVPAPAPFVLVAGSVRRRPARGPGWAATGPLPDLAPCFQAADFALNPMLGGSGMNVKVGQCLAHALPVVTTAFGARGYAAGEEHGLVVAGGPQAAGGRPEPEAFARALWALADPARRAPLAAAALAYATRELSWARIARLRLEDLGALPG